MNTFTRWFRTVTLAALVSVPAAGLLAQAPVIPDPVKASFAKSNPGITPAWGTAGKGYEARFAKEGQKMVYIYDAAGVLQVKKVVTEGASLPSIVNNTIVMTYAGAGVVKEAYKVSTRSSEKYYEVVLETATTQERLKLNETGTILNKASRPLAQASAPAGGSMASAQPAPATKPAPAAPAAKPAPTATTASSPAATTSSQMARPTPEDDLEYVDDEDLNDLDDLDSFFPATAGGDDAAPLNDNFLFEDETDSDPYSDLANDDD